MKVYAIYTGCIWEGGSVREIYADKENAIKFALMLVEEKNKWVKIIHSEEIEDGEDWDFKEQEAQGMVVKCWANPVDEIIIYEYDLK